MIVRRAKEVAAGKPWSGKARTFPEAKQMSQGMNGWDLSLEKHHTGVS